MQKHEEPPACQASTTAMVRKRVQRDSRSPPGTRTGDRLCQPSTKYSKVSVCEVKPIIYTRTQKRQRSLSQTVGGCLSLVSVSRDSVIQRRAPHRWRSGRLLPRAGRRPRSPPHPAGRRSLPRSAVCSPCGPRGVALPSPSTPLSLIDAIGAYKRVFLARLAATHLVG